jgi:uncharacterized protein (DUF927 family)
MADEEDVAGSLDALRAEVAEGADVRLPPGFSIGPSGVWFQPKPNKDGDLPPPVWVCGRLEIVAETADEQSSSWGLLIRWEDRNGRLHEWAIPRRLIHQEANAIASDLEDAGLSCGASKWQHQLLKQFFGGTTAKRRKRCVSRSGWHTTETGNVYVLAGGKVFGPGNKDIIFQTDRVTPTAISESQGSLEEWQQHMARFAVGNHRLGLCISTALTAPLLEIVGEPSGGLHLFGKSQSGKTTALACGASVWGRPDTSGWVRTWRATANGMEGVAAETCDALLALDEINMVDAREVGDIVYSLANETGKARAARDGSARARRTWRILYLSTGEVPLAVKMGERGHSPMAGQNVRLANIPADAGAGHGVFQDLHGMASAVVLVHHLRNATRQYYGTAARAFLDELTKERATDYDGLAAYIADMRRQYLDKLVPEGADGQVISVAARFALITVAGELACTYGILPWPAGEAFQATRAGFRAWLDSRGGTGASEDAQAIATVRRFIEQHGESRFGLLTLLPSDLEEQREDDHDISNRAGFRRRTMDGWQYLIFPECFKSEVCKGLDAGLVAKALHAVGFLEPGEKGRPAKKHRIKGFNPLRLYTIKGSILEGAND